MGQTMLCVPINALFQQSRHKAFEITQLGLGSLIEQPNR